MASRFRELMANGTHAARKVPHALYDLYKRQSERRKEDTYSGLQERLRAVDSAIESKIIAMETVRHSKMGFGSKEDVRCLPTKREKLFAGAHLAAVNLAHATLLGMATMLLGVPAILISPAIGLYGIKCVHSSIMGVRKLSDEYLETALKFMQETYSNMVHERTVLTKKLNSFNPQEPS